MIEQKHGKSRSTLLLHLKFNAPPTFQLDPLLVQPVQYIGLCIDNEYQVYNISFIFLVF